MSAVYSLEQAWIGGKWESNVEVRVDDSHNIQSVTHGVTESAGKRVDGWVVPGIPNVHSHAFQWTFAGCSEFRTGEHDSFWTWREQMYASLKELTPDEYYRRARLLYCRMRRAGYTSVGEFHYVHMQDDGNPYDDLAAMSEAVITAANEEGLAICILPVLYQRGGFDNRPLAGAQLRFGLTDDQFLEICESLYQRHQSNPNVNVGMAIHSLRAVDPTKLSRIVDAFDSVAGKGPIHIHVAEQTQEVDDCVSVHQLRPVELLYESTGVDERWCLIHATHLNDREIGLIADSGATVGLCPMTEANLGDGIFRAEDFVQKQGRFAIGSDSHVSVCPFSEMRAIEYSQRWLHRRRAILCSEEATCGEFLLDSVVENGSRILALDSGQIAENHRADWVVLDPDVIGRYGLSGRDAAESLAIDRAVFCEFGPVVKSTLACGAWKDHQ